MPSWFTERRNAFGAGALSLLLITASVVTAIRTDGYRATQVNLNDASVWIAGEHVDGFDDPQLGRVNTEVSKINFNLSVSPDSDLYQDGPNTFYLDGSKLISVDGSSQRTAKAVMLGKGAVFAVGGSVGAVLQPDGKIWVLPVAALATFTAESAPTYKVDPGSLLVVGVDGVAHTHAPGSSRGFDITASGEVDQFKLAGATSRLGGPVPSDAASQGGTDVQLTAVGSRAVVLDGPRHRLLSAGGAAHAVGADVTQLQQPGPSDGSAPSAVVAGNAGLQSVVLNSGAVTRLVPSGAHVKPVPPGTNAPTRPVVVGGCAYGAWASGSWEIRFCDGQPQYGFSDRFAVEAVASDLVFRVNHERVVLNDADSGAAWTLSLDGVSTPVTGWEKEKEKDRDEADDQTDIELPKPERQCDARAQADFGTPEPATIGARKGIPVRFSLAQIEGVSVEQCRVPSFDPTKVKVTGAAQGAASVVDSGAALQLVFAKPGSAVVTYYLNDGAGNEKSSTVTVEVKEWTNAKNSAPRVEGKPAPTIALPGHTVGYDVSSVAMDPDGDPVSVVDACIGGQTCLGTAVEKRPADEGAVQYQPDGWIRYTPAETVKPGTKKLSFKVADAWGAESSGTVDVVIQDPKEAAPVTHDDRSVVVQGQQALVDVLANDVSVRGEGLKLDRIAEVQPAAAQGAISRGGPDGDQLVVSENAPKGTIVVKYVAGDSSPKQAEAYARIDVRPVEAQPKLVAVLDRAVARGKAKILVDLTANDFDSAGNVLVVQKVSTDRGVAQLLGDNHTVRVIPPDGFDKGQPPMVVTYDVSNGFSRASGTLVVSPYPSARDQAPFARPDGPVEVKAGEIVAIPVLANDADPEGAPLRLLSVSPLDKAKGRAFVEGDELRFEAPEQSAGTSVRFTYDVTDAPLGRQSTPSSGDVTVVVLPASTQNRAPKSFDLTERAIQGVPTHVSVPLLEADPDGDQVAIVSTPTLPMLGRVTITGDGFDYEPLQSERAVGTDTFTFVLSDGKLSTRSTVRIGIAPRVPSDGPTATPIEVVTRPNQDRPIDLLDPTSVTSSVGDVSVKNGREKPVLAPSGAGSIGGVSADGVVVYRAPGGVGADGISATIDYTIEDSDGSTTNYVMITVDPDAPQVDPAPRDDFVIAKRAGEKVELDVLENDADPTGGDKNALKVSGIPQQYSAGDGKIRFTMPEHGVRFTYTVTNPDNKRSAHAVVSVPVLPPVAVGNKKQQQQVHLRCDATTVRVKAGDSSRVDVLSRCDGSPRDTLLLVDNPAPRFDAVAGTATVRNQVIEVSTLKTSPSGEFLLASQVCVKTSCADTMTAVADLVTISGSNEPPNPLTHQVSVPADSDRTVDLAKYVGDPNPGDAEKIEFSNPSPGSLRGVEATRRGSSVTFKADADAYDNGKGGPRTFTVTMKDPQGATAKATITVSVTSSQSAPIRATDDRDRVVNTHEGVVRVIDVLENDVNRDNHGKNVEVEIISVGTPSNRAGQAKKVDGGKKVEFKADPKFGGETSFTYMIAQKSDKTRTATGTVTIAVIGYPAAPMPPIGTNQEIGRVSLKWEAPDANGGSIDQYRVECMVAAGGSCPREPMTVTGPSVVFDGLKNGVAYKFRVQAHNEAGWGEWGGWSGNWKPDQLPTPPQVTQVGNFPGGGGGDAAGGGGKLTVTWTQPPYDGTPVTAFVVHFGSGAADVPVQAVPGQSSYTQTFGGLVNGTPYQVWVDATNEVGTAPLSGVGIEGTPATMPAAPGAPTITSGDAQLMVSWAAPRDNGSPITKYTIEATSPGNPTVTATVGGSVLSTPIGTVNGETYAVRVKAENATGEGPWGPTASGMSKGKPDPVTSGRAVPDPSPSGGAIILTFSQPNVRGSDVNRYQVRSGGNLMPAANFTPRPAGTGSAVTLTLTGLSNGTAYGPFTVRGCNSSHGGSDDAQECADWSGSFSSPGGGGLSGGQVAPFGAPTLILQSKSATSAVWRVQPSQPGVDQYTATCSDSYAGASVVPSATVSGGSISCNFMSGGPRRVTVRVTAHGQGLSSPESQSETNLEAGASPVLTVTGITVGACLLNEDPASPVHDMGRGFFYSVSVDTKGWSSSSIPRISSYWKYERNGNPDSSNTLDPWKEVGFQSDVGNQFGGWVNGKEGRADMTYFYLYIDVPGIGRVKSNQYNYRFAGC